MIYSSDINKICALCVNAVKIAGDDTRIRCSLRHTDMTFSDTCSKFKYDILKKQIHRRKKLKSDYKPEDFTL